MGCSGCSNAKDGKPAGCKSNGYCSSSGCNKLDVFDWLAGVPIASGMQPFDGVEVRFKNTRKAFYRNDLRLSLLPGDLVTVDASPGYDMGMVSLTGELVRAQMERRKQSSDTYELRKILRKSTQEDIDRWHAARKLEDETMFASRAMVREAGLDMKVSDVEYQGDGTKAIFYYTAEDRIDFRGIVRQMSDRFKIRVEMKQIGARQEAGRVGGIGSCGRELCCSTWLTEPGPVNLGLAKDQRLGGHHQRVGGARHAVDARRAIGCADCVGARRRRSPCHDGRRRCARAPAVRAARAGRGAGPPSASASSACSSSSARASG